MKTRLLFSLLTALLTGPLAWGQLLTVTAPNGGETFAACDSMTVSYTKSATASDHQRIEVSYNGGRTYYQVDTLNTAGALAGMVKLAVANIPTAQGRVRVREYTGGTAQSDASDADFTISPSPILAPLLITAPGRPAVGIDTFAVASTQRIRWSGETDRVYRLSYSYSTTSGFVDIATVTGKTYYDWNIPLQSSRLYLRVQDTAEGCRVAYSDTVFRSSSARPGIGLTSFNGGETVAAGENYVVRWNVSDVVADSAVLELSLDSGATYQVLSDSLPLQGSYAWTVPVTGTTRALFRISVRGQASIYDISNGVFTISRPLIQITSPSIAGPVTGCQRVTVSWTASGSSGFYQVLISANKGRTWYPASGQLAYGPTGSFTASVKVPAVNSDSCLLEVIDPFQPSNRDTLAGLFTIQTTSPRLELLSPNGGQVYAKNTATSISWLTVGTIPRVDVLYSPDAGQSWTLIAGNVANNGQQAWTTPTGTGSAAYIVRVQATGDTCLATQSDRTFAVTDAGVVNVLFPTGGEQFLGGSTQTVRWQAVGLGQGDSVTISYSSDGTAFTPVASVPNSGSYAWAVPNVATNQAYIRVADRANAALADTSGSFQIIFDNPLPALTLLYPNGGELLYSGDMDTIRWTASNLAGDSVKLQLSVDAGLTYVTIRSLRNVGKYAWRIPNLTTTRALVRVADFRNNSAADTSDTTFTIRQVIVRVTAPNGGQTFTGGTVQTVTWATTNWAVTDSVSFSYTTDGVTYSPPVRIINSGSYAWTVPSVATTTAKVRITARTVSDVSDAAFTIEDIVPPFVTVQVIAPNGSEIYPGGSVQQVLWSTTGLAATDSLDFSYTTDGVTYSTPVRVVNAGSYGWLVPNVTTTMARVRLATGPASDESDGMFSIQFAQPVTVRVLEPNGGDLYTGGTTQTVFFTSTGLASTDSVDFSYTTDGVAYTVPVRILNSGTYSWVVPNVATTDAKVRIASGTAADVSDAAFTIELGTTAVSVQVISPNGGETFAAGSVQTVSWTTPNLAATDSVDFTYTTDDVTYSVPVRVLNTGSYNWTVPDMGTVLARVRITADTVADSSDGTFTILPAGPASIMIVSPNGGELLMGASPFDLTWTSTSLADTARIEIAFSSDFGGTFTVTDTVPNTGVYSWPVPNVSTTAAFVRLTSIADPTVTDLNDLPFNINFVDTTVFSLTVLSPRGGDVLRVGQTDTIRWSSRGLDASEPIQIEFSADSGYNYAPIAIVSNTGSFEWTVPDAPTPFAFIRLSSLLNDTIVGVMDSSFSIIPGTTVYALDLTAPDGGEVLTGNTFLNINWTSSGYTATDSVDIQFSTDSGATYTDVALVPNTGNYAWTTPNIATTGARIRISIMDTTGMNAAADSSQSFFTIVPTVVANLTLTAPNGGEVFDAGVEDSLRWTSTGLNPDAQILVEFSADSGLTYTLLDTVNNTGTAAWTPPLVATTRGLLRISLLGATNLADASDSTFTILYDAPNYAITVTSPNGGEVYNLFGGGPVFVPVSWQSMDLNFTDSVRVEYSADSGLTYTLDSTVINGTGAYNLDVTGFRPGNRYLVRLSVVGQDTVSDVSDSTFAIIDEQPVYSLTLLTPNGGEVYAWGPFPTDLDTIPVTWSGIGLLPTDSIRIEISADSGATYTSVVTVLNTGSYDLTGPVFNPFTAGDRYLIRITVAGNDTVRDVSDTTFTIDILDAVADHIVRPATMMQTMPNPAAPGSLAWVSVTALPDRLKAARLTVVALDGRLVSTQILNVAQGKARQAVPMPTTAGLYLLRLEADGVPALVYRMAVK